jgi:DNA-binding response OmpR family regulator
MLEKTQASQTRIFCCAPDPDARRSLAEKISTFGHQVLSTGNPRIAAGLLREADFDLVVIALSNINLAFISVIVEARRASLRTPVLVVFTEAEYKNFPEGFADVVLCKPTDGSLLNAINVMSSGSKELATAL